MRDDNAVDGEGSDHDSGGDGSDHNSGSGDEFSDAVDDTMAPVKLECPVADCNSGPGGSAWSCEAEPACAAVLLQVHGYTHQAAPAAAATTDRKPRPPSLQPPKLEAQCSESRFEEWKVEWSFYKRTVDMPAGSEAWTAWRRMSGEMSEPLPTMFAR